jgi:SAM-dependent methyltransferase
MREILRASCPVCDETQFGTRTVAGITIRRCTSCGVLLSEIAPAHGIDYRDIDENAYAQSIAVVRRRQAEQIVALVRQQTATTGEWLDVGCGHGFVLDAARTAGFRARGIEPNPTAAAVARARIADVEIGTLDADARAADVLSTLDVIEHLHDLDTFAQLARSKARALWVIKVPSTEGFFFIIAHALRLKRAVKRLWQSDYAHPHLIYFNRSTLTRYLTKHGFDVVLVRHLDEVPTETVVGRLTLDRRIPRWMAQLAKPLFFFINVLERLRGKSDALLVVARPRAAAR